MNQQEIRTRLDAVVDLLLSKGYAKPEVTLRQRSGTDNINFVIAVAKFHKNGDVNEFEYEYHVGGGVTYKMCLDRAVEEAQKLPLIETVRRQQFNQDLAEVIEAGKRLGADVAPLLEALRISSENLIEAPK